MDNTNISPREDDTNMIRLHVSGTPTISELRRRVWVRAHPKESAKKPGGKPRARK